MEHIQQQLFLKLKDQDLIELWDSARNHTSTELSSTMEEDKAVSSAPDGPLATLQSNISADSFWDLEIIGPDIVCSQSPVFANMCEECRQPGVITLADGNERPIVELMINFLYFSNYEILSCALSFGVHVHEKVYAIAVRYQIKGLQSLALRRYGDSTRRVSNPDVYFQSVRNAYLHSSYRLTCLRTRLVGMALIELRQMLKIKLQRSPSSRLFQVLLDSDHEWVIEKQEPLRDDCGPLETAYEFKSNVTTVARSVSMTSFET